MEKCYFCDNTAGLNADIWDITLKSKTLYLCNYCVSDLTNWLKLINK